MYLLGIALVLSVYVYVYQKHKDIIKYLPISKQRLINLNDKINSLNHRGSLYTLYINIVLVALSIVIMSVLLKLNIFYIGILVFISLTLIPLILIWNLNFKVYDSEFNNLTTYLTQFILVFKSHQKILFTLEEIVSSLDGELKELVLSMILNIKDGSNLETELSVFNKKYPHFIVFNLHSLVLSVEKYGSDNYFEALDLIQDDIDDWIDDTHAFTYEKNNLIRKINILILFAFGICYMALNMLSAVELSTNTPVYQMTVFLFCFIQISTYIFAHSILNFKFIQKSETIC